jgi:hypothetical protein
MGFRCHDCGCRAYLNGPIPRCWFCSTPLGCMACIGPNTPTNQAHRRGVLLTVALENYRKNGDST